MQKASLELEQGLPVTKESILVFISEFTNGNLQDKAFQKTLIDNLISTVYVYDDRSVVYFSVGNTSSCITKEDTDKAIKKGAETVGSTLNRTGGERALRVEPEYIFVNGIAGFAVKYVR